MTLKRFYNLFIKDLYGNGMVSFVERNDCDSIVDEWLCSVSVIKDFCNRLLNEKVTSWDIVDDKDYGFMIRIELTTKEQTK